MKRTAKKLLLSAVAITGVTFGAVGTASAGYTATDAFGNVYYVPTCHAQWVQTGPFYGQGYWHRICG